MAPGPGRGSALAADLAAAVARAGVDPTLPEWQLEDVLRAAIADRRGDLGDWWVRVDSLWHVGLLVPDREPFRASTLAEALAWALVWTMGATGELGVEAWA